jgi:hypothetical protein
LFSCSHLPCVPEFEQATTEIWLLQSEMCCQCKMQPKFQRLWMKNDRNSLKALEVLKLYFSIQMKTYIIKINVISSFLPFKNDN